MGLWNFPGILCLEGSQENILLHTLILEMCLEHKRIEVVRFYCHQESDPGRKKTSKRYQWPSIISSFLYSRGIFWDPTECHGPCKSELLPEVSEGSPMLMKPGPSNTKIVWGPGGTQAVYCENFRWAVRHSWIESGNNCFRYLPVFKHLVWSTNPIWWVINRCLIDVPKTQMSHSQISPRSLYTVSPFWTRSMHISLWEPLRVLKCMWTHTHTHTHPNTANTNLFIFSCFPFREQLGMMLNWIYQQPVNLSSKNKHSNSGISKHRFCCISWYSTGRLPSKLSEDMAVYPHGCGFPVRGCVAFV